MRPINREIIALAGPAIVTNITTPLLGLVDTAITGHMGSAAYVGAIAVGAGMFSLAYWPLNFLRMGTSGLTSQAYGALSVHAPGAQPNGPALALSRAAVVGIAAAIVLMALSPWIADGLLAFMDADASTTYLARQYFMILVLGAPAVLGTYALTGWLLGLQDSRTPMWMALVTNVSNIALSLWLVYGLGLKIEGVAIGTLASQWLGLIAGSMLAWKRHRQWLAVGAGGWRQVMDPSELKRYFKVNADIFVRTLCLAAVTLWFAHAGAVHGADTLAANALLMQLFVLFSYFMDGFAFAGEAMAGKYCGQRNGPMLRATVRGVFGWGAVVAAVFTLAYAAGARLVLDVLTSEEQVVAVAMRYAPWAVAVPAAGVAAFAWDGIFIGLTYTRQMLVSMLAAVAVFFALYFTLSPLLGNHGLWLAFISYLAVRGLIQTLLYRSPTP